MKSKTNVLAIILTVSAVALGVLHLQLNTPANAGVAVSNRDFQLVTSPIVRGGDGLYILDNRTGFVALFAWDNARRTIELRDVRPMKDLMSR